MTSVKYWKGELSQKQLFEGQFIPGDALVLVAGGIVEGNHNPLSDIDVLCVVNKQVTTGALIDGGALPFMVQSGSDVVGDMLIGEEVKAADPSTPVIETHHYVDSWGTRCDIDYILRDELHELCRLVRWGAAVADRTYGRWSLPSSAKQRRRLHRLLNSAVLQEGTGSKFVLDADLRDCYSYCLMRGSITMYAIFQDIVGAYIGGQFEMAFELARSFLIENTMALTHALGSTNDNRKWLPFYMDKYIGDVQLNRTIREALWAVPRREALRDRVVECLDVSDAVVQTLINAAAAGARQMTLRVAERVHGLSRLDPHAGLSFEYYSKFTSAGSRLCFRDFIDHPGGLFETSGHAA